MQFQTIKEINDGLVSKKFSVEELIKDTFNLINENKVLNCFISLNEENALERAKKIGCDLILATSSSIEDDELEFHNSKKSNQFHAGGGGLFSTPRDYSKFMQIFLNQGKLNNHTLLSKENFKNIFLKKFFLLHNNYIIFPMPHV